MHHTNLTVEVKVVGSPTVVIVVARTVSSAHGARQRHPRFLTPPTSYPAARNYAIPTGVIGGRRSSPFQPRCPCYLANHSVIDVGGRRWDVFKLAGQAACRHLKRDGLGLGV